MKIKLIMALSVILVSMLLIQDLYGAENADKYLNFELRPVYGINQYDAEVKNIPAPSALKETYANFFGADKDFSKGIISYLEYLPGEYGVVGGAYSQDKKLINQFTSCDFKGDRTDKVLSSCGLLVGIANADKQKIIRLNTPEMRDLSGSSMIATGSRNGFPIYGCYVENPFVAADLNLDGVPELFVFGGLGQYGDGATVARTSLYIFDVKADKPRQIFKTELSNEDYQWDTEHTKDMDIHPAYQSYSLVTLNDDGSIKRAFSYETLKITPVQGIRRYAKLYFKDFNKNGKLDILVWRREYKSRLNTDPVKGYKLSGVTYKLYEESSAGFVKQPIQESLAEKYLKDNNLTWRKGFPWKNQCLGKKSDDPLIDRYQDPKQNINDPVLEH